MTSKALIIGDPHFCERNLEIIEQLILAIEGLGTRFDAIIVLGDILHNHRKIDLQDLFHCHNFISRLRRLTDNLIMLIGNHDRISNNYDPQNRHAFNVYNDVPGVRVIDVPTQIPLLGVTALMVPYLPTKEFAEQVTPLLDGSDICIAHQDFKGANYGHVLSENGNDLPPIPVISGHIHKFQYLRNVLYLGTPYQTSFAEQEKKYVGILRIAEEPVRADKWRVVDNESEIGRFILEQVNFPNLPKRYNRRILASEAPLQVHNPNDEYQYRVTYSNEEEARRAKQYLKGPKIRASYIPAVIEAVQIQQTRCQNRLSYVNKLHQRAIDLGLEDIYKEVYS